MRRLHLLTVLVLVVVGSAASEAFGSPGGPGAPVVRSGSGGGVGDIAAEHTPGPDASRGAVHAFGYPPGNGATAVATGDRFTCVVTANGGVQCWGINGNGQLGDGTAVSRGTPADVTGLTSGVTAVTAGAGAHACALTLNGGVKCWGANWSGQLGDGTGVAQRPTPVDVSGLTSGVVAVTAGNSHTCALTSGGGVKCWGMNYSGQLGDGTTTDRSTPVDVTGLTSGVVAVTGGYYHTCALTSGGAVKCWGTNWNGQLGDGTTTQRTAPVDVSGLTTGVSVLATGVNHTCAVTSGGSVKCWGDYALTPVEVSGLTSGVAAVSTGGNHTCAVMSSGGVKCWGLNSSGQLGDGTTTQRTVPVDVSGLAHAVSAVAAGSDHTCALATDGGVQCWGSDGYGQLGVGGNLVLVLLTPADVPALTSGVSALATGYAHSCVVTVSGGVKCWGSNTSGQLGDGTTATRGTPAGVSGLAGGVAKLALGDSHSCALTSSGGVKCWGNNSSGQLGDGTYSQRLTPVDLSGLTSGVAAIVAGSFHTCALTTSGGVKCWGANSSGQLGDGTSTQRKTPVDVSGLTSGVIAVAAGYFHTCALTGSGGVKCWGANWYGQLGDGTTTDRAAPAAVTGLTSGAIGGYGGYGHTCALTSSGGVKCWGDNSYGQLGDGTTTNRPAPVDVVGLTSGAFGITGWGQPHVRVDERRRGEVLGVEQRPAGRRHDDATHGTDRCERAGQRDCWGVGRELPHLCADDGRRREVLGDQFVGAAR